MTDSPLRPEKLDEDTLDRTLRPERLADFIGQSALKDNLSVFIQAARERQESLDHILLHGPPGLGKTTLSQIVAKELGVGFRMTSGAVLAKAGDLAAILTNLQPNDVLFIDEIHRLPIAVEEVLYPAMEDFKLDLMIGEGPAARSVQIDLPAFTLIGATTRAGLLSAPLRERFGIPLHVQFYTHEELGKILTRNAGLLKMPLTSDGAFEIARRARGTPRVAGRLLRRVRDFTTVDNILHIDAKQADIALKRLLVDEKGLDHMDRQYLQKLIHDFSGGPVGVETLTASLSEVRDVIEDVIEPFLIQQGFIARTARGRVAMQKAFLHLGLTPPNMPDVVGDELG